MELFVRRKNRLVALTPSGEIVLRKARSALLDLQYITNLAKHSATVDSGELVIATTHTLARYVLPATLKRFARKYPKVRVTLQQGAPAQIVDALLSNSAHFGLTGHIEGNISDIVALECSTFRRIVLGSKRNKLARKKRHTLQDLATYPLVSYEPAVSGGKEILDVFTAARMNPNIILRATDADVVKACVERGLGVTVIPEVAFDARRDDRLAVLATDSIFPPLVTKVAMHRKHHFPSYVFAFIEMFAPQWSRQRIEELLSHSGKPTL